MTKCFLIVSIENVSFDHQTIQDFIPVILHAIISSLNTLVYQVDTKLTSSFHRYGTIFSFYYRARPFFSFFPSSNVPKFFYFHTATCTTFSSLQDRIFYFYFKISLISTTARATFQSDPLFGGYDNIVPQTRKDHSCGSTFCPFYNNSLMFHAFQYRRHLLEIIFSSFD